MEPEIRQNKLSLNIASVTSCETGLQLTELHTGDVIAIWMKAKSSFTLTAAEFHSVCCFVKLHYIQVTKELVMSWWNSMTAVPIFEVSSSINIPFGWSQANKVSVKLCHVNVFCSLVIKLLLSKETTNMRTSTYIHTYIHTHRHVSILPWS
jgi:hypothetical protein